MKKDIIEVKKNSGVELNEEETNAIKQTSIESRVLSSFSSFLRDLYFIEKEINNEAPPYGPISAELRDGKVDKKALKTIANSKMKIVQKQLDKMFS